MKTRKLLLFLVLTPISVIAADRSPAAEVSTVAEIDLERYSGKWFEVARFPNRFQKDCIGATAEYGLRDDGAVSVLNTCYRDDGTTRSIEGKATPGDDTNAKLQVRFDGLFFKLFGWLIKADYWVLELGDDYRYAVVGTPNRGYLWILSRERTMDEATYRDILSRLEAQGFDVDRIVRTEVPEVTSIGCAASEAPCLSPVPSCRR